MRGLLLRAVCEVRVLLMEGLCFNSYNMHQVRNVVPAVLAYPSTSGGGCLLTQCDMTTLLLGGCVLMTIPISEDTLLPSHAVRNVVSAVLAYPSTSRRRVSVDPV